MHKFGFSGSWFHDHHGLVIDEVSCISRTCYRGIFHAFHVLAIRGGLAAVESTSRACHSLSCRRGCCKTFLHISEKMYLKIPLWQQRDMHKNSLYGQPVMVMKTATIQAQLMHKQHLNTIAVTIETTSQVPVLEVATIQNRLAKGAGACGSATRLGDDTLDMVCTLRHKQNLVPTTRLRRITKTTTTQSNLSTTRIRLLPPLTPRFSHAYLPQEH